METDYSFNGDLINKYNDNNMDKNMKDLPDMMFSSQESTNSNELFDAETHKNEIIIIKRIQKQKITTEIHQKTVTMMMEASKELWKQHNEHNNNQYTDNGSMVINEGIHQGFTQKPYW